MPRRARSAGSLPWGGETDLAQALRDDPSIALHIGP
jgi:hypothetical protein